MAKAFSVASWNVEHFGAMNKNRTKPKKAVGPVIAYLAQQHADVVAVYEVVGLPEVQINLAHGTTYLATASKSNASYAALLAAKKDAKEHGNFGVPLHLRNAVTSLMEDLDYGKGFRDSHDDPAAAKVHLPKELEGRRYYRPTDSSPPHDEEDLSAPW